MGRTEQACSVDYQTTNSKMKLGFAFIAAVLAAPSLTTLSIKEEFGAEFEAELIERKAEFQAENVAFLAQRRRELRNGLGAELRGRRGNFWKETLAELSGFWVEFKNRDKRVLPRRTFQSERVIADAWKAEQLANFNAENAAELAERNADFEAEKLALIAERRAEMQAEH